MSDEFIKAITPDRDWRGLFDAPPPTPFTFLSLGAGVQSSTLALMAARGEVGPMPNAAIFADTQAEPKSVYVWLDWLKKQLPFPVYRVTAGSLADAETRLTRSKRSGKVYRRTFIPAFALNKDGTKGIVSRKCTPEFKIRPIIKKIRELAQIKRGQTEVTVTQWIGISWDEIQRMKNAREAWSQARWPLIELRMTRRHCLEWMRANKYPEPPRSACTFCPFHSDAEWRRLRDESPDEMQKAIEFEKAIQEASRRDEVMRSIPFLHSSLVPLGEVDFTTDIERGQGAFDFQSECEGMCGV